MALDPSIPLQGRGVNLGATIQQALSTGLGVLQLKQGIEAGRSREAVRNAFAQFGGDPAALSKALYAADPGVGMAYETKQAQLGQARASLDEAQAKQQERTARWAKTATDDLLQRYTKTLKTTGSPVEAEDALRAGAHDYGEDAVRYFGKEQAARILSEPGQITLTNVQQLNKSAGDYVAAAEASRATPQRYVDPTKIDITTGKPVGGPEAKPAQSTLGKLLADVESETDPGKRALFQQRITKEIGGLSKKDAANLANKVGDDYATASKNFELVQQSYLKIQQAAREPSAAGDMALVFGIMKMYDPTSVVRESEYATAQNATGVPAQVLNLYNRVLSGERLNPKQRADFVQTAGRIFDSEKQTQALRRQNFKGIAERAGLDPQDIVGRVVENPAADERPKAPSGRATPKDGITIVRPPPRPEGKSDAQLLDDARAAMASGAPRKEIEKRLKAWGVKGRL